MAIIKCKFNFIQHHVLRNEKEVHEELVISDWLVEIKQNMQTNMQ